MDKIKIHKDVTKIFHLGGLEEVGKNTYCIEHNDELIIIDCGIKMPSFKDYGYNFVIADYKYLLKNKSKIKALCITHGHEDHIGAVPYLYKILKFLPDIYAPKLAINFIKSKIKYHRINLENTNFYEIDNDSVYNFENFKMTAFSMIHSIPDAYGLVFEGPNGTIVTSGDWRFDFTPLGPDTNFYKINEIGKKGCDILLSDSTNSFKPKFSDSEQDIIVNLKNHIKKATGRIIVSAFASNVYRVKEIIKIAISNNRKVFLYGRSMIERIKIASSLNYIDLKNLESNLSYDMNLGNINAKNIVILCTGSQGEVMSALSKMANGNHTKIKLRRNDTIILSSSAIPGNYLSVYQLIDKLLHYGAHVITNTNECRVHTSGHGHINEQKLFINMIKPKYFIPIHGEYNMLLKHKETAIAAGVKEDNVFVCKNGDVVGLYKHKAYRLESFVINDLYIESREMSNFDNNLLCDHKKIVSERQALSNAGLIIIIYIVNEKNNYVIDNIIIRSRGTFYVKDNSKLVYQLQKELLRFYGDWLSNNSYDFNKLDNLMIENTKGFIYKRKKRLPLVRPIRICINKDEAEK